MSISIRELWNCSDPKVWNEALTHYWDFVQPANKALEEELEHLSLESVRGFDGEEWYRFLLEKYFRWKYTAPNRYATTTAALKRYEEEDRLEDLDAIRCQLLHINCADIRTALKTAIEIRGLGTAGASGLLSLLYPHSFGTVDQFVVKALLEVDAPPEARDIRLMNPESLSINNGALLTRVMRRKAAENNRLFTTEKWTPRRIDQVLWTYGRSNDHRKSKRHRADCVPATADGTLYECAGRKGLCG